MLRAGITALLVMLLSAGCGKKIPGGEITVRNDIRDKEYNVVQVSHVRTTSGSRSFRVALKPGQYKVIPFKNIRSLRFSRKYKDHSKVYEVECPKSFNRQVVMKLIDVHLNRIGGGCFLVKRGKSRYGHIKWE